MKKESTGFRCEQWFGKNWQFIFWFWIIAVLVFAIVQWKIMNRMESLEKTLASTNGMVVLTTVDGRAIKVTKTPLKAEYLKQFAISTFINNFIVSRSQLTDNFQQNVFVKASDVLSRSKNLNMIYTEYIDRDNKKATGDYISYIQWILSAIGQDKLPEYISIRDWSIQKFEYVENSFSFIVDVNVNAQSYILAQDKYVSQLGTIRIESDATFNLEKSSENNPYGMRIEALRVKMITKSK